MAEKRPNISPSEQILPGGFNLDVASGDTSAMSTLPISDVFEIPLKDIPLEGAISPAILENLNQSLKVNQFFVPSGPSTPVNEKLPVPGEFDLSDPGTVQLDPERARMRNPVRFSAADTGFDRYFAHPKFNELGFTPYDPNIEQIYNNNSGLSEDLERMGTEFWGLFLNAAASPYRAISDYVSGDGFTNPDFEGAMAFENAMRVGNSSRGGVGGFVNNLLLNSAYTFGIIGSIAAEELALLTGSALVGSTGVGAPAAAGAATAGTMRNIYRIGKAIKDNFLVGRMASATADMIKNFNNVSRAKNFWTAVKTGNQPVAKFFLPSSMRALRELNSSKVAVQNLGTMAKLSRGFGGFYRDLRALNLAVAESKMEAGLNYNEQFNNAVNILQREKGRDLTPEEMAQAQQSAAESAHSTFWWNVPFIYATNQLVLGRALQGFGGRFGRIFDESLTNFGRRIIRTKATRDAAGKATKDVFEDAGEGLLGGLLPSAKRIGAWTVSGTLRTGVHGALRYSAKGLAEGTQEVYQEAVNVGTQDYFSELLEHPSADHMNLFWGGLNEGVSAQMSSQGFETFMSGFLMGGLVQGPQRLVFQKIPNFINSRANPEQAAKYKQDKQDYIDKLVDTYNKAYNKTIENPDFQWNPNKLNFAALHDAAKEMDSYNYEGDPFGFYDAKDFLRFQQAQILFDNGGDLQFTRALNEFLGLTDEELAVAFPEAAEDARNGKLRTRLQDTIAEINKKKDRYRKAKSKYENKYDPSRFKPGTRKHYIETIKYRAYEHARYLYLFTEDGFYRALERSNKIYEGLAAEPIFKNIAANDLQALADAPSIEREIKVLEQEIEAFKNTTDADVKKDIQAKKRKLKALQAYQKVFTAKQNQIKDGSRFSRTAPNIKKLRAALLEYVTVLAEEKGDFVDTSLVDKVIRMLIDYGDLKGRTRTYDKAIKILADPKEVDRLAERMEPIMNSLFRKNKRAFIKQIGRKIAQTERTELLKAFNKLGILVPPDQAKAFLNFGSVKFLQNFENKEGAVTETSDPELFAKVQELIANYNAITTPDEVTETKETKSEQDFDNAKTEQEENFEEADATGQPFPSINTDLITPREEEILGKLYKKYRASVPPEQDVLTEDQWIESNEAKKQYNGIQKLFKLYDRALEQNKDLTFDNWLSQNKNKQDIRTIFLLAGLKQSDFVKGEIKLDPKGLRKEQKFIKKGKGINIVETQMLVQGVPRKIYQILDNELKPVSNALYRRAGIDYIEAHANIQSADKAFNILNKFIGEDVKYSFDGIELGYGDTIVDDKGQQYFVIGTPNSLVDGSKLKVRKLPGTEEMLISESGFSTMYKLDDRSFKEKISRPEKTKISRIKKGELNSVYPIRENRNSLIETFLDDPDFKVENLSFEITKNKQFEKPFVIKDKDGVNNMFNANPYIKQMGDKYAVAIKYNDKVIGYVANGQYKFDFEGKPLNLNNSLDALQFLFDMNSKTDIVAEVLAAQTLVDVLDKMYADNTGTVVKNLQDFKDAGINFNLRPEKFDYQGSPRGLSSYTNNTFEGGRLILIRRKLKDPKTGSVRITAPDYISDFEAGSPEALEQFNKAMKEINQSETLIQQYKRKGYSAVTRKANGEILLIPLDIDTDVQGMQDLMQRIVDESQKLSKNNVNEKGKAKDLAASKEFNSSIAESIFIKDKPGDKFTLKLNALGDVVLEGIQSKKSYAVKLTAEEYLAAESPTAAFNQLLAKFNEQGGNLTLENFAVNIAKDPQTIDEIVNATSSTLQVIKPAQNRVLFFSVDSEIKQPREIIDTPQPKDTNTKVDDKVDLGKVSEMSQKSDEVAAIDELAIQINDAIAERDAIRKKVYKEAREAGLSRRKAELESKELKAAENKIAELKKKFGGEAYKVLPFNYNGVETQKIDAFITWANQNLPEFINVGNVNEIGNRLKNNGITAGAFIMALDNLAGKLKINGTIYVGTHGFRYHEAFHAVFRMLLTSQEQKQYLAIAEKELRAKLRREGKSFEEELQKFRGMSALYESFTRKGLEQEFFEEYMADEFQKFKENPRNSTAGGFIKSFFTRLINWIKTILGGFTKNQLTPLFENIDSGKFKSRGIANNMFTGMVSEGAATIEAYKLLPVSVLAGERTMNYEYLDGNTAEFLTTSFAARVLQLSDANNQAKKKQRVTLKEIEDQVFDEFADLYDPDNARYKDISDEQYLRIKEIDKALNFRDPGSTGEAAIIEGSRLFIDTLNLKQNNLDDINEVFENDLGLRSTDQWDKDASMVGGVTALPMKLRAYIATTTVEDRDYFGNQFLVDPVTDETGKVIQEGVKLIIPVNVDEVYNGVLKAVKNKTTDYDILSSMYQFGQGNAGTKAFVTRLFNDMGIDGELLLESGQVPKLVARPAFFQQVVKSFQNARINYLFVQTDTATKKNYYYDAATRDASKTQLAQWQQTFDQRLAIIKSDPAFKNKVLATIKRGIGRLQASRAQISNPKFDQEAQALSRDLYDALGIALSPEYLKLSMLKASDSNIQKKTKVQELLLENHKNTETLRVDDLSSIRDLIGVNENIYSETSGAASKLRRISIGNAQLDERVGATTFTNANGDMVYAHQMPTFHTRNIGKMNNEDFFNELREKYPDNPLIQNENFTRLSAEKKLSVLRKAGFRKGRISLSEQNEIISDGTKSFKYAKTYGTQSPQEFIINLFKLYSYNFNSRTLENKMSGNQALAPVLIRVLEASNTGDMIDLPVIKTIIKTAITKSDKLGYKIQKETLDVFYKQIQNEYERIVKEIETPTEDLIIGYNADKNGVSTRDTREGRAYKLFNTKNLLPADVIKSLEDSAYESIPFAEAAKKSFEGDFFKLIEDNLNAEIDRAYKLFGGAVSNDPGYTGSGVVGLDGVKTGDQINIANAQLNLVPGAFLHNFAQIYLNNKINTTAINELLLGDESLTLQGSIDQIKRAKGQNGAIRSIQHQITAPQLGILHPLNTIELYPFVDPTFTKLSGDLQNQTDAQVYYTEKGFRHSQFGMGNMTKSMVDVLDYIKDDEIVPSWNINDYVGKKNALNSKKMVYFDGSTYIKMSVVPLTKEFTSLKDENGLYTIPKPNKVKLHNLRVKMEAYENANETVVFSAPTTALKMLKKNVDTAEQAFSESPLDKGSLTTLQAEYMGLQMVNPSNKMNITTGNQMRVLLTSEQNDVEKVKIDGVTLPMAKIRKLYNDNISGKINLAHTLRKNAITDQDGNVDLFTFLRYAIRNLKASKSSSNIIEQFETDEKGNQKYGLNSPHMVEKAEQLFLTYFNTALMDRNPGMSLALMSDYGVNVYRRIFEIDENGVPTKFEIIRENIFHRSGLEADIDISDVEDGSDVRINDLRERLKDNDSVVVVDRLRSDLLDADGVRYSEFVLPAHFQSVHDDFYNVNQPLPEVLQKHFGIRIPSQDKHSAVNLRLVDFMPHYMGSTGVFAREILERSGADFDIDKLYTHMKAFYKEGNTYNEYGKNGFKDYITFVTRELTSSKPSIYKDVFEKWSIGVNNVKPEESVQQVLAMLRMPSTEDQYNKYVKQFGEPYSAAYSNKDLDYKYALLGNKKMTEPVKGDTPIIAQEAGISRLLTARTYMEKNVPGWAKLNSEVNEDVNGLLGQFLSFKNNKEGARNIGLAVRPNLVYSMLREYKVSLDPSFTFTVNQNKAEGFANNYIGKDRTAILFDELITAMTDNAKERLAALLGLSRQRLPLVSAGIALGIPLNDIILLLNSPVIGLMEIKKIAPIDAITTTEILKSYGTLRIENPTKEDADTINKINISKITFKINQIFKRLEIIASRARSLGNVMSLDKGHGKNYGDIQRKRLDINTIYDEADTIFKSPIKDDNRFFKIQPFYNTSVEIHKDLINEIMPKVFFRYKKEFRENIEFMIFQHATRGMQELDEGFGNDTKFNKISLDYLSFLLINKYRDALLESSSKTVGSLSNEIIYEGGKDSIVDLVNKLRKLPSEKDNYFLNMFLQTVQANDPNSKDGLNKVVSNTFARLSDNQLMRVQNGFAKLYGEVLTRLDAIKLLHYIIVKDGLQFNTGSIMQALSPFILEHFLDKTQDGNLDFKKEVEFINGYFQSGVAQQYLTTVLPTSVKRSGIADRKDFYTFSFKDADRLGISRTIDFTGPIFPRYIMIGKNIFRGTEIDRKKEFATYTIDEFKGSLGQNAIGFMFNTPGFTRPSTNAIKEAVDKKTSTIPMPDQQELMALDKMSFDVGTVDIVANEKSITVDEKNINTVVPEKIESIEVPLEEGEFRVISGGQTGVDQAGLEVAAELGIETGGTAPKGYRTERGTDPTLKRYGLDESASSDYLSRTEANVVDSDATVYFAADKSSAGLKATERFAKKYKRPISFNPNVSQLKAFIKKYNVKVLNVAGNRESKLTPDQLFKFKNVMKQAFPKPKTLQTDQFDIVEGEVKPETTSKIKDILKAKGRVNEELLGQFWDNEINPFPRIQGKTGYQSYGQLLADYKAILKSGFSLSEQEFIEQTRCKF